MVNKTDAKVLLVEDDEDIGMLLEFLLTGDGFAVVRKVDGQNASDFIENGDPCDVALLDVMLPNVDGIELLRRIRANSGWDGIPVIMLTSKSTEKDIELAKSIGATDYITKPFLPQEVLTRIRDVLDS